MAEIPFSDSLRNVFPWHILREVKRQFIAGDLDEIWLGIGQLYMTDETSEQYEIQR